MPEDLLYRDEVYRIVGACWPFTKTRGMDMWSRFIRMHLRSNWNFFGISFDAQRNYQIHYRDRPLKHTYTPDLLCFDKIIVELKAAKALTDEHRAQLLNYLKVTRLHLGLLVNFGSYPRLEWERIVLTHH